MKRTQIVVIWPYHKPSSTDHLNALVDFIAELRAEKSGEPILIINRCAERWLSGTYRDSLRKAEMLGWDIHRVWSTDTCQSWLEGLGYAYTKISKQSSVLDSSVASMNGSYYYLIPADFHYATPAGKTALAETARQIELFPTTDFHMLLGEIQAKPEDFKEIMDRNVTWPLLKLWFPQQYQALRSITSKPRSEFIALTETMLQKVLCQRWLPYEQTLITLIRLVFEGNASKIRVYNLGPLEEDQPSHKFKEFITQAERMERALRLCWRDVHADLPTWAEEYQSLSERSQKLMRRILAIGRVNLFA